jgi:hypothetical protein
MANRISSRRLTELSNSGYEIVSDEPDIRKWKVKNGAGKILGVVDELLVDRQTHKVRYLVLNIQGKPLNLLSRKVLVPIGIAELDRMEDVVILPTVTLDHLATLPVYKKSKLNLETERKVRHIFSSPGVPYDDTVTDDVFYEHEHFDDRNFYKGRQKVNRTSEVVVHENTPPE